MNVLPIASISDLDQDIFSLEILKLAKLKRGGFPVLEGIAINAPQKILDKITAILDQNKNNSKLNLDSNQFKKVEMPDEFKKYLLKNKHIYFKGELTSKNIWPELTSSWWNEFITKYKSLHPEIQNKIILSERIIFFLESKINLLKITPKAQILTSEYDEIIDDFLIDSDLKIDPVLLAQIDEVIKLAHKFLTIPHNFELIIWNNKIYITKVNPYTTPNIIKKVAKAPNKIVAKNIPKSAVQSYFNIPKINFKSLIVSLKSESFEDLNCILNGEDFPNFEEKVKIIDFLKDNFPKSNIIYKFPDIAGNDISGSLRLLHQPKILEDACNFVLFLRNKKNIGNLDIAIPLVRSVDELLKIKREIASYNMSHKNGMRFWIEICTPENLINIDKYLEASIEGLIINLDKIENLLIGFKTIEEQNQILAADVILELLIKVFKSAHKLNLPIIISGKNYITSGLLETFISWGVYGLVVNSLIEAQSLPYYLVLLEKKLITSRINLPN